MKKYKLTKKWCSPFGAICEPQEVKEHSEVEGVYYITSTNEVNGSHTVLIHPEAMMEAGTDFITSDEEPMYDEIEYIKGMINERITLRSREYELCKLLDELAVAVDAGDNEYAHIKYDSIIHILAEAGGYESIIKKLDSASDRAEFWYA